MTQLHFVNYFTADLLGAFKKKFAAYIGVKHAIGTNTGTGALILSLKAVGVRLTVKQVAKYVPLAGQVLSVAIGYAAMQYVGRAHILECARVVELVRQLK